MIALFVFCTAGAIVLIYCLGSLIPTTVDLIKMGGRGGAAAGVAFSLCALLLLALFAVGAVLTGAEL